MISSETLFHQVRILRPSATCKTTYSGSAQIALIRASYRHRPRSSTVRYTSTKTQAHDSAKSDAQWLPPISKDGGSVPEWDENPDFNVKAFSDLPSTDFGVNQHILINDEVKEALRQILWQFRAPIRYAFAYGSGVFAQTTAKATDVSLSPPAKTPKMIDFIFGVSHTQHWHSLNLSQHRDHYSSLSALGSSVISRVQDQWGAGVYFNPYVTVNGTLIKYGVVNLDTLCQDLSGWNTLYLAGRLHKPVKILRDNPRVRLSNQINLISAVRTALLLLPEHFSESQLYGAIAGISYMGDPRMSFGAENANKVNNIIKHQHVNFRNLYASLIKDLPNIKFTDSRCSTSSWFGDDSIDAKLSQDMDPQKRGNMVRRLPTAFRDKLYRRYQAKYQIPQLEFMEMMQQSDDGDPRQVKRRQGGAFEQRIASEDIDALRADVCATISEIVKWPSYTQSMKGFLTSGLSKSWRYIDEKRQRRQEGVKQLK